MTFRVPPRDEWPMVRDARLPKDTLHCDLWLPSLKGRVSSEDRTRSLMKSRDKFSVWVLRARAH